MEISREEINLICSSIGKLQALIPFIRKSCYEELKGLWEKEAIEETEKIFKIVSSK